jgi:hypothetical protein
MQIRLVHDAASVNRLARCVESSGQTWQSASLVVHAVAGKTSKPGLLLVRQIAAASVDVNVAVADNDVGSRPDVMQK